MMVFFNRFDSNFSQKEGPAPQHCMLKKQNVLAYPFNVKRGSLWASDDLFLAILTVLLELAHNNSISATYLWLDSKVITSMPTFASRRRFPSPTSSLLVRETVELRKEHTCYNLTTTKKQVFISAETKLLSEIFEF